MSLRPGDLVIYCGSRQIWGLSKRRPVEVLAVDGQVATVRTQTGAEFENIPVSELRLVVEPGPA